MWFDREHPFPDCPYTDGWDCAESGGSFKMRGKTVYPVEPACEVMNH